jgi:hypothetical protein
MSLENTIRNLLTPASPRKGTAGILSEASESGVSTPTTAQPTSGRMGQAGSGINQPGVTGGRRFVFARSKKPSLTSKIVEGWFDVDIETAKKQQASNYVDLEKRRENARDEYRRQDKEKVDQAIAERNRQQQSQIKYEEPPVPDVPIKTNVVSVSTPAPTSNNQPASNVTPPTKTPQQKAASDAQETESSVPNPRPAGGGLQAGSGLNTTNVQANQQRFTRQLNNSYIPNSRKNFIRESVMVALNETGLKHWKRAVNVLKKRGETGTKEYEHALSKLKTAEQSQSDRFVAPFKD